MNNWTLHEAIKRLKDNEVMIIKYDDSKYTFTLTKWDKSQICSYNDLHITSQGLYLDCGKITLISVKSGDDDL